MTNNKNWLEIAKELKSIAQAGRTYSENHFQLERFQQVEQIAAKIFSMHTNLSENELSTIFQQDAGYPTPKVDTRGAIFRNGEILLVKEIEDGNWTLPGGWADNNLTPSANVEREIFEESGYHAKAGKLVAVFDRDTQGHTPPYPFNIYKMFFLCEITGGTPTPSDETSEIKFFAEDEIPTLSASRTLQHEIELMFDHYRNPDLPTVYD